MRLHIENFAKIGEADITIDGVTTIAGENNAGKSTVGKILFSLFNALCGIENKVFDERMNEIYLSTQLIIRDRISATNFPRTMQSRNARILSNRIEDQIKKESEQEDSISEEGVRAMVQKEVEMWRGLREALSMDEMNALLDEISENINEILELPEENIILEAISGYFNNIFHDQLHSLAQNSDNMIRLDLEIKGKRDTILFTKNQCEEFVSEINITHKAIYIDNPFIIDELTTSGELNPMGKLLKELLTGASDAEPLDGIIETLRAKEKMSDIYEALGKVVDGDIEINKANDEFYLRSEHFDEPISFHNLSTGLKSFVILKMLLEKGCIKEKDIIILDEPEIHLHPQWQIAYAELIVLLQKHFDLSVVVTTHSPYFVDAINLFTRKYGTDDKANYYLSTNAGNVAVMENVSDHIDMIYKKMASPIQMLDTLRYELNNK